MEPATSIVESSNPSPRTSFASLSVAGCDISGFFAFLARQCRQSNAHGPPGRSSICNLLNEAERTSCDVLSADFLALAETDSMPNNVGAKGGTGTSRFFYRGVNLERGRTLPTPSVGRCFNRLPIRKLFLANALARRRPRPIPPNAIRQEGEYLLSSHRGKHSLPARSGAIHHIDPEG